MTAQETFDIGCEHLRKQNAKSVDAHGMCMYRGPNGMKCAVGIFIPDEVYEPWMEGKSGQSDKMAVVLDKLKCDYKTCCGLQMVHDHWEVKFWEEKLKELAMYHNLVYTALEATT